MINGKKGTYGELSGVVSDKCDGAKLAACLKDELVQVLIISTDLGANQSVPQITSAVRSFLSNGRAVIYVHYYQTNNDLTRGLFDLFGVGIASGNGGLKSGIKNANLTAAQAAANATLPSIGNMEAVHSYLSGLAGRNNASTLFAKPGRWIQKAELLVAELDKSSATLLNGTVIGTPGSWNNGGLDRTKCFDGNISTAFDGPTANGVWCGLDFGSAMDIIRLRFYPRAASQLGLDRATGGKFQVSSTADFSSDVVTLYTIPSSPSAAWYEVGFSQIRRRYARFLSPNDGYGNIAEIEFYGADPRATLTSKTRTTTTSRTQRTRSTTSTYTSSTTMAAEGDCACVGPVNFGKYLGGYCCSQSRFPTLAQAIGYATINDCGVGMCGGITKESNGDYTFRKSTSLGASSDETSWLFVGTSNQCNCLPYDDTRPPTTTVS